MIIKSHRITKPSPHPLDFEWLFNGATIERVVQKIRQSARTMALGAPTIAEALELRREPVMLIDRQPLQNCRFHVILDPNYEDPINISVDFVVTDPPWYLPTYFRWLSWAAQHIAPGGTILCALWQPALRPTAAIERDALISWLKTWSILDIENGVIEYESPKFELRALEVSIGDSIGRDTRTADLLLIKPFAKPILVESKKAVSFWHRFIIDDYQLALKLKPSTGRDPLINEHPSATGGRWRSTSLRAQGRDEIGLWSSDNEVAKVEGPARLIPKLRKLLTRGAKYLSPEEASCMRPIMGWNFPNRPPKRVLEWTHQE